VAFGLLSFVRGDEYAAYQAFSLVDTKAAKRRFGGFVLLSLNSVH
jgi:hypothetical protein